MGAPQVIAPPVTLLPEECSEGDDDLSRGKTPDEELPGDTREEDGERPERTVEDADAAERCTGSGAAHPAKARQPIVTMSALPLVPRWFMREIHMPRGLACASSVGQTTGEARRPEPSSSWTKNFTIQRYPPRFIELTGGQGRQAINVLAELVVP